MGTADREGEKEEQSIESDTGEEKEDKRSCVNEWPLVHHGSLTFLGLLRARLTTLI